MDEEKQALMGDSNMPSAPPAYTPTPTAYTSAPTQYQPPPQAHPGVPPQYAGAPAYPPQHHPQQQQQVVAVVTGVPVQQREVWYSARGGMLPQPDPNRVVIGGTARYRYGMLTSTSYTYADQLPCLASAMLVFMFLCFFFGTPLSLLCTIPGYIFISRVCHWTCSCMVYQ